MKILGLQHAMVEQLGYFRQLLSEDRHKYHAVDLNVGEQIPDLDNYSGLWAMKMESLPFLTGI